MIVCENVCVKSVTILNIFTPAQVRVHKNVVTFGPCGSLCAGSAESPLTLTVCESTLATLLVFGLLLCWQPCTTLYPSHAAWIWI